MQIFQYAVILHPTPEEAKNGKRAKLVVEVTSILAKDESGAIMQAARSIPEEFMDRQDRLEVAVRPF